MLATIQPKFAQNVVACRGIKKLVGVVSGYSVPGGCSILSVKIAPLAWSESPGAGPMCGSGDERPPGGGFC